jgi:hypothetical protein
MKNKVVIGILLIANFLVLFAGVLLLFIEFGAKK